MSLPSIVQSQGCCKVERKDQHLTEVEVHHPNGIPQRQADVFSWLNFEKVSLRARVRMARLNCKHTTVLWNYKSGTLVSDQTPRGQVFVASKLWQWGLFNIKLNQMM